MWSPWILPISAGVITLLFLFSRRLATTIPKARILLALLFLLSLAGLTLTPARAVVVYEYGMVGTPVPWEITVDKDGAVWITEQGTNKIGRLSGSTVFEWSVPTTGGMPWGITGSKDHADIWFTEEMAGKIGKFVPSPVPGKFYEWALPSSAARPRGITMNITKLSTGKIPANSVWFTEFEGHRIGHLYVTDANEGVFSFYDLGGGAYPLCIAMSPVDYSVWFTEYGTGKIGSIKLLESGGVILKHYETSSTGSKPWGIGVDPDGYVWVTESATGCLGRLNPTTGEYVTFTVPTANSEPRGLAIEATTSPPFRVINVWLTEFNTDKIAAYDPGLNVFFEYPIISSGGRPHGITITGPGGNVWFTEPFAQKIGMLSQTHPKVTSTTVGTITSAATTSKTVATVRTTNPSLATTAAAVTSTISSAEIAATAVTSTYTFTSTKLYMTTTSIYSWTVTSRSTSYTTKTTTTTYTQVVVSTSTLPTTTTTTATSTSWNVETSTLSTSLTNTIVQTSTSSTTTTLTATSTLNYPTVSVTVTSANFIPTTTYSPTVTLTSAWTSVVEATSIVTSVIETTTTITTTVAVTRPCIIASAAYGSELAPEVQFLREFRDGSVVSTFAGTQFMKIFYAFYYSFSPTVAQFVAGSSYISMAVRGAIYPLLVALKAAAKVSSIIPLSQETRIVFSGVLAGCVIGAVYIMPAMAIATAQRRRRNRPGGT